MDVLTEVLSTLRVASVLYARIGASAPWGIEFEVHQAIKFCLVARGTCCLVREGLDALILAEGDFLLTSPGARYTLCDQEGTPSRPLAEVLRGPGGVRQVLETGGGGGSTTLLNGILTGDAPEAWVLGVLPPFIVIRHDQAKRLGFDLYLQRLCIEAEDPSPGAQLVANWLGGILFVHSIRAYADSEEGRGAGWLGALSDRRIASALQAMHEDVARRWTVEDLARVAGMSRSSFAEEFRLRVGKSPLVYLTDWRMHRAKVLLGDQKLAWVASRLGYQSDTAFSKAFKSRTGMTPSEYRRAQASSTASLV